MCWAEGTRREPGDGVYSWIPAVAHAWWLTPSSAPSTLTDPEELAGPREDPDPEPERALRQLPEARAEARQRPHLPRTEGQGREGTGLAAPESPSRALQVSRPFRAPRPLT